jgi:hypothetical protein
LLLLLLRQQVLENLSGHIDRSGRRRVATIAVAIVVAIVVRQQDKTCYRRLYLAPGNR